MLTQSISILDSTYSVESTKHGVIVRGSIPVDDLVALTKEWKKKGLTIIDTMLGEALLANMVITSKKGSKEWRAEVLVVPNPADPPEKRLTDWLKSGDTGTSSRTIAATMTGRGLRGAPGAPMDDEDLGRCQRLLSLFPEWRPRLSEVSSRYPEWEPWIRRLQEVEG